MGQVTKAFLGFAKCSVTLSSRFVRIGRTSYRCDIVVVIPPVASTAGEGGKPSGEGHPKGAPLFFAQSNSDERPFVVNIDGSNRHLPRTPWLMT